MWKRSIASRSARGNVSIADGVFATPLRLLLLRLAPLFFAPAIERKTLSSRDRRPGRVHPPEQ
jgi:hypothetical protein